MEEQAQTIPEMGTGETSKGLPTDLRIVWKRLIGLEDLLEHLEKIVCVCDKNAI